jgi:DNA modification methylase
VARKRIVSSKEELKSAVSKTSHDPRIGRIELLPISSLKPAPNNPRKHSRQQIRALSRNIEKVGFNTLIAVDKDLNIVVGHARVEAAKILGYGVVPVLHLDHLTVEEARAYMLADNKLGDRSSWDDELLAAHLKELSGLDLNFDIEAATGFEIPEIDLRIQSLENPDAAEEADEFEFATGLAASKLGDLWLLGGHRLLCGNALEESAYRDLLDKEKAAATFTDPPYNVPIDGHVSGTGKIKHREFAMGAGELSEAEFTAFLTVGLTRVCSHTDEGALLYYFMDWRHTMEIQTAARAAACDQVNLCVWVKSNGGLGSLYRSRHELVFVFKNGKGAHLNNVQLGRFGRNRTNVWSHPAVSNFVRQGTKRELEYHPTVKPILLVSDAILDSTARNDIVLDPFLGSGTTLLSAQRTERRCYGIELDPLYVDTAIERWQRMTGSQATNSRGETFDQVKLQRSVVT